MMPFMKFTTVFYLLPFLLIAQKHKQSSEENLERLLQTNFYANTIFVHHEFNEEVPADTLSYTFSSPEVRIETDTLFLSYIQKYHDNDSGVTIKKIVQSIPLSCIEETMSFNFSFGATDRFEPGLTYLGFAMLKKDCNEESIYEIDFGLWESGRYKDTDFIFKFTDSPYIARFPMKLTKKTLKRVDKCLKLIKDEADK
jgi:hypothetical protein